jgi:hypothetical protein
MKKYQDGGEIDQYRKDVMQNGPSQFTTTNTDDDKKDFPTDTQTRGERKKAEKKSLDMQKTHANLMNEYDKKDKTLIQKKNKGGAATSMASGGSASSRGDGCAVRGKTKGRMV